MRRWTHRGSPDPPIPALQSATRSPPRDAVAGELGARRGPPRPSPSHPYHLNIRLATQPSSAGFGFLAHLASQPTPDHHLRSPGQQFISSSRTPSRSPSSHLEAVHPHSLYLTPATHNRVGVGSGERGRPPAAFWSEVGGGHPGAGHSPRAWIGTKQGRSIVVLRHGSEKERLR